MAANGAAQEASSDAYRALETLFAQRHHLGEAQGILGWDRQVMMPDGAAGARAETQASLAALSHDMLIAPRTEELLAAAEEDPAILADPWRAANLRGMRRAYAHAAAVPSDLVEAASRAESAGEMAWREAREKSDFALLAPALETLLTLQRQIADAKAEALGLSPYDALLDQFEPGARAKEIDRLFAELSEFLPDFTEEALETQAARQAPAPLSGPFPIEKQRALALELMQSLGFDASRGRLDVSLHPFCGGSDDDVRITTRYNEDDFSKALMGVLHETGHALYEQGLPSDWRRAQPVGRSLGMANHESQSLFIEMQICRSAAFMRFAAPKFRAAFGAAADDPAWSVDAFTARAQKVEKGFIRVDTDEVTYPAHVILRYRLERAMIDGDLVIDDLPGAWDDAHEALMGARPPNDADGCLQDIHWPAGAFGYFPTYTLGALAAAQLREAAEVALPDLDSRISAGDFKELVSWLREAVHSCASLKESDALLRDATGSALETASFRRHLKSRYGAG